MDQRLLKRTLISLPLGKIRFLKKTGSTNDIAAEWALKGAENLSLVVADEQIAGKGRYGRRWITHPHSALAFSLILSPEGLEPRHNILLVTAMGALAITDVLESEFKVMPEIKWPNDVLLSGRKIAGILSEGHWIGDQLIAVIMGIGINVAPKSVPPDELLDFPATCVEKEVGRSVDRMALLKAILQRTLSRLSQIGSEEFVKTWETRLAYKGQWVKVTREDHQPLEGRIVGLERSGQLRIQMPAGEVHSLKFGDVRLRPVDRRTK